MNLLECTKENTKKFSFSGVRTLGKCVYVVDGDTMDVAIHWKDEYVIIRIRLLGINTPEIRGSERDDGIKSKKFVEDLLLNKLVAIECFGEDNFGRVLANIYTLKNVSETIVENGYGERKEY
jgi:micrococcal nuclease